MKRRGIGYNKQYNGKKAEKKVYDKKIVCLCDCIDTSIWRMGLLLAAGDEICDSA